MKMTYVSRRIPSKVYYYHVTKSVLYSCKSHEIEVRCTLQKDRHKSEKIWFAWWKDPFLNVPAFRESNKKRKRGFYSWIKSKKKLSLEQLVQQLLWEEKSCLLLLLLVFGNSDKVIFNPKKTFAPEYSHSKKIVEHSGLKMAQIV